MSLNLSDLFNALSDKLSIITESLNFIIPEVAIIAAMLVFILIDLISKKHGVDVVKWLSFAAILAILWADFDQLMIVSQPIKLFLGMIQLDQTAGLWKVILDVGLLLTLFIHSNNRLNKYKSEYFIVLFAILLGGHLLVMSANLLMVYLAVETMSIGAYVLTTFGREGKGYEASMKYLIFGAVASAVMIYGMSLIYAMTGSLAYNDTAFIEPLLEVDQLPILMAGLMVIAGLLFKISAAPMHIWTPDVYEVAPTSAVAYMSVVPKLAGFAVLVKWMLVINLFGLGEVPWSKIVGGIAVLTLIVGNLSALWQTNVKRMLAYSAIAHSGFLLLAVAAFSETGFQSLLFYAIIYLLMNMAVFALVNYFEQNHKAINVADYQGLGKQFPYLTALMVIIMIALTGLPPTAGFSAKLFVFSGLWESYAKSGEGWMLFVFIFGLINAVISLFYYLKVPYYMIFRNNDLDEVHEVPVLENFLASILVLALLTFFFKPEWLMDIINSITFAL